MVSPMILPFVSVFRFFACLEFVVERFKLIGGHRHLTAVRVFAVNALLDKEDDRILLLQACLILKLVGGAQVNMFIVAGIFLVLGAVSVYFVKTGKKA